MKTKAGKRYLFVEVQRRGVLIDSYVFALDQARRLVIGDGHTSNIHAPLYKFGDNKLLGEIKKSRFELYIDHEFKGFYSSEGVFSEAEQGFNQSDRVLMMPGDAASLNIRGLNFNLRLGKAHPEPRKITKLDANYRPKPLALTFQNPKEAPMMFLGACAATTIVAGFMYAILTLPAPAPLQLEDLPAALALKFIDPNHLRNAPEAMPGTPPDKLITNSAHYYRALTATVIGMDSPYAEFLPRNSRDHHYHLAELKHSRYDQIEEGIQERLKSALQNPKKSALIIPSAGRDHLAAYRSRIQEIVNLHHDALEINRNYKVVTGKSFDESRIEYIEGEYRKFSTRSAFQDTLSQIKVLDQLSSEEMLVKNAEEYADQAALFRLKRERVSDQLINYDISQKVHRVVISPDLIQAFPISASASSDDRKYQIAAGAYLGKRKAPPQPVFRITGELPEKLIEKTVRERQYELQLCYELALRRDLGVQGEGEWTWIVDPRGRTEKVSFVQGSINDRAMIDCVGAKIARWQFPRPKNGSVRIHYPFKFVASR